MFTQLLIGTFFLMITVILQSLSFDFIIKKASWLLTKKIKALKPVWKALILSCVTFSVACVLIAEVWIWGIFYYFIGAVPDFETALYFSTSSFTTVGFGDVYLQKDWRLLSSIEAMNGFIMFGWATAFIFEIVSQVYKKEGRDLST
jgi:hypothetical protein